MLLCGAGWYPAADCQSALAQLSGGKGSRPRRPVLLPTLGASASSLDVTRRALSLPHKGASVAATVGRKSGQAWLADRVHGSLPCPKAEGRLATEDATSMPQGLRIEDAPLDLTSDIENDKHNAGTRKLDLCQQQSSIGIIPTVITLRAMPSRLKKPSNATVTTPSSLKSNSSMESSATWPWERPAPAAAWHSCSPSEEPACASSRPML